MASPRSLELKQGTKEPSMEEEKRCELNLPVENKRIAHIHCGRRVPTGAIASRNLVEEEKVPTPVRRLVLALYMVRSQPGETVEPYHIKPCGTSLYRLA
jgi:hypothetical protein